MEIIDNCLIVDGEKLEHYTIIDELGRGANGIVYLTLNNLLQRHEALKIWIKRNENDSRDKKQQGILEATKLAANNPQYAVQIYHIGFLKDTVYATMEYIDGMTLQKYCELFNNESELIEIAYKYLEIIEKTSVKKTLHGDPHWNNVLIYIENKNRYNPKLNIKLCDFGTSYFTSKEHSQDRHWKIVKDTIFKMTKKCSNYKEAKELYDYLDENQQANNKLLDYGLRPNISEHAQAMIRTASLRDYLECLNTSEDYISY